MSASGMRAMPLAHLTRPVLRADRIAASGAAEIVLEQDGRRARLSVGGDAGAALGVVSSLRDPDSPYWSEARDDPDGPLTAMLSALDRAGWIAEAVDPARDPAAEARKRLAGLTAEAAAWLDGALDRAAAPGTGAAETGAAVGAAARTRLAEAARAAGALVDQRRAGGRSLEIDRGLPGLGDSLPALACGLMLRAWQTTAPAALAVTAAALARAADGGPEAPDPAPEPALVDPVVGMIDAEETGGRVWSAVVLAAQAVLGRQDPPLADAVAGRPPAAGPGINLLLDAEAAAERLMARLGPSPLHAVLADPDRSRRVAGGIYLHQHFVTIRYLDAVMAFARHGVRPALRRQGMEYLLEEVGHDVHERAACRELGLSDAEIDGFAPLPLFAAYPDVLGLIAEADPVAFCFAVTVAEGLPGAPKRLAEATAAQGLGGGGLAAHQAIDAALDHALFTRRLTGRIPWVEAGPGRAAIRRFLIVAEIAQRAWSQLAAYAADPALDAVPRAFAAPPERLLPTLLGR